MFADELPLGPTEYDWVPTPTWRNRRRGDNCSRDAPEDHACERMGCSACTKVLRDNVGPQTEAELKRGNWKALTLVDPAIRLSDQELANMDQAEFDKMIDGIRDKARRILKFLGISNPRIIGAVDISRETEKLNGREINHWFSPHIHACIETAGSDGSAIQAALNRAFQVRGPMNPPAEVRDIKLAPGWIGYFLKDPRDMYRRVRLDWSQRPSNRVITKKQSFSSSPSTMPRRPPAIKQSMSEREAVPLIEFLSRMPVNRRLFLVGYQYQGRFHDGRLIRTNYGLKAGSLSNTLPQRSPGSRADYRGDVNNPFEQGHNDQLNEVETHKETSGQYRAYLQQHARSMARLNGLRIRNHQKTRPRK